MKVSAYVEAALASLVYKQAEFLAKDLELFARHARRSTIQVEDVKLCARRNPEFVSYYELNSVLSNFFMRKFRIHFFVDSYSGR